MLRDVGNKTNFALDMHAVFGKHRGIPRPSLFPLFNVHEIFLLKSSFLLFVYDSRSTKVKYDHFCWGVRIREGGPNPLADIDSWGSISASRFGPGGPYPLADLDRGVQIQGGPNPLGHRRPAISPVTLRFSPAKNGC